MHFVKSLFRTKPLSTTTADSYHLKRCLTSFDLILLGIGGIIGAGIFVLTGIAAATKAGPAAMLSYIIAGLAASFSALAYAELSSSIGGCGSAYGYSMTGLGEFIAWLIGWDLLLEYSVASCVVAIGWSGYMDNILFTLGLHLPHALTTHPFQDGGLINLPAMIIIGLITLFLGMGVQESARFNKTMVFIKMVVIALFIVLATLHFKPGTNWKPFLPFGWVGVVSGASLVFFAYLGFDAVSTAAEESVNPKKDLPIGIMGSLLICTLIYIVFSALLTGVVPYKLLNVSSPVSFALLHLKYPFGGAVVALGAIAGLTTAILVLYYGFTRVFLAMARDGLLPSSLSAINSKTKTPLRIIIISGVIMAILAGIMPIERVAELANMGTLMAFSLVCLGVIWMRYKYPEMNRPFKTPWCPVVPLLGVLFCIFLMSSLHIVTWQFFGVWTFAGILIYFGYSRSRSVLHPAATPVVAEEQKVLS